MFLFRSMFWIILVLLLLPSEDKPHSKTVQSNAKVQTITTGRMIDAQSDTLVNLSGFCARNVDVCSAGGVAFEILQDKAKNAMRLVMNWAQTRTQHQDLTPKQVSKPLKSVSLIETGNSSLAGFVQVSEILTGTVRPRMRPARPAPKDKSQNTLEIKDLIPTWNGPRATTRA